MNLDKFSLGTIPLASSPLRASANAAEEDNAAASDDAHSGVQWGGDPYDNVDAE